jgi:beta-lactamase class A
MTWDALDRELAAWPGTVSVYVGRLGARPAYTRLPAATHYAASMMKVGVLAALHSAGEAGMLELDRPVPVRNEFDSADPTAPRYRCNPKSDNDEAVWERLDGQAPLRWLARRMIVRSSNLATNIVLSHVGLAAVAGIWALVDAQESITGRGIDDAAARDAGITNLVTAADLAALMGAIALGAGAERPGPLGTPAVCREMRDVLLAQERREDLPAGLPAGTRIAHKNGWVGGVRHAAGVVYPDDAPPYALAVCTTADPGTGESDDARPLIAGVSGRAWEQRHGLAG